MATSRLQALWNHPAGPKTIHFWAPTFKWGISIANIADFAKPTDKISYPQQIAWLSLPKTGTSLASMLLWLGLACTSLLVKSKTILHLMWSLLLLKNDYDEKQEDENIKRKDVISSSSSSSYCLCLKI